MAEEFVFDLEEKTLENLQKQKNEMGFKEKTWNEWFKHLLDIGKEKNQTHDIIERIFQKNTQETYYDDWIRNFSLNLEQIWTGHSAKELAYNKKNFESSSIVIGRGPSLLKNNHLEILANSNYNGNIVCCDGALPNVLQAEIKPKKFKNFFVVTIDSQIHQKKFYEDPITLQNAKGIKCILSTTVPPSTYQAAINAGMEVYWVHTLFDYDKGKSSFNYISGIMSKAKNNLIGLPAIQTGGNVGTSSWIISWAILKSKTVCLIGLDQGYPVGTPLEDMNFHGNLEDLDPDSDIFKKAFPVIRNPEFNTDCIQNPLFQYYCNALKEFIEKASSKVKTINATEGGALFGKNIECMKFQNFLNKFNF